MNRSGTGARMQISRIFKKPLPPVAEQTPKQMRKAASRQINRMILVANVGVGSALLGGHLVRHSLPALAGIGTNTLDLDVTGAGVLAALGGCAFIGALKAGASAVRRIKDAATFAPSSSPERNALMRSYADRATRWLGAAAGLTCGLPVIGMLTNPLALNPTALPTTVGEILTPPAIALLVGSTVALGVVARGARNNLVPLRQLERGDALAEVLSLAETKRVA